MTLRTEQYPETYVAADETAARAQVVHFRLLKTELVLLFGTAAAGSIAWSLFLESRTLPAVATALIFILLIALGVIRYARRYDRLWFRSRAIAESAKVETWRFMMRNRPYSITDETQAEQIFLDQIQSLLSGVVPETGFNLAVRPQMGPEITDFMRSVRRQSIPERLTIYKNERVRDQRDWYGRKAEWNARREGIWFFLTFGAQVLAAGLAVWIITTPVTALNPVGVITTLAASGGSWSNARSHRELAQSYAMVSRELGILEEKARHISTEDQLASWVEEVEHSISREHTMWVRRRAAS